MPVELHSPQAPLPWRVRREGDSGLGVVEVSGVQPGGLVRARGAAHGGELEVRVAADVFEASQLRDALHDVLDVVLGEVYLAVDESSRFEEGADASSTPGLVMPRAAWPPAPAPRRGSHGPDDISSTERGAYLLRIAEVVARDVEFAVAVRHGSRSVGFNVYVWRVDTRPLDHLRASEIARDLATLRAAAAPTSNWLQCALFVNHKPWPTAQRGEWCDLDQGPPGVNALLTPATTVTAANIVSAVVAAPPAALRVADASEADAPSARPRRPYNQEPLEPPSPIRRRWLVPSGSDEDVES